MKHSSKAWDMAAPIYGAILQHPFNQDLMKGTLSSQKFRYYLEQDRLFLKDLSSCLALIASKIQPEYVCTFLQLAEASANASRNLLKQFSQDSNSEQNGKLSRATQSFTSYLLSVSAVEPVEVAVAAVLPTYWVYSESGSEIAKGSAPNNPFANWIAFISGKELREQAQQSMAIFDALAEKTTDEIRQRMLEAFSKSTMMEWHFWNDVYEAIAFELS
jgi:thiaminase/transcriptional activator TenA